MSTSPLRRSALALAGLILLSGCAVPSKKTTDLPVSFPEAFSVSGEGELTERWWETMEDEDLASLIEEGLTGSFTLTAAWERLAQADATARRAEAPKRPFLDGTADAGVTRRANTIDTPLGDARTRANDTNLGLGLAAGYEVDLWGRIESLADAAALDATASAEDLEAAAVTLSWRIADTWVRLLEQWALQDVLLAQIKTDDQILELIDLRFRTGRVPAEDVLRQRQLQEAKRETLAVARESAEVLEKQLAVLLGRPPTESVTERRTAFPVLPALPATGAPSDLMLRRPDVRAALLRVHAADARVAAALADRYPSVRLTGAAAVSGPKLGETFDNWLASAAAGLTAPLFDGGAREAEVERSEAVVRERIASLGQVVLVTLEEVEVALAREARQREVLDSLAKQKELSDEIVQRTRDRYLGGAADYLRVLEALATAQGLERRILAAKRVLVQDRLDLYRALAGGWALDPPVEPIEEEESPP
ncbi:MAG: efflux transporter outer membrane subunit, partial [Planctomycetota bacterium]